MSTPRAHNEGDDVKHDSYRFNVVPIIVLPGVAGTRLEFTLPPHWDVDSDPSMLALALLPLRLRALQLSFGNSARVISELSSKSKNAIRPDADLQDCAIRWLRQRGESIPASPEDAAEQVYERRGWGNIGWNWYGPILRHLEVTLNPSSETQVQYPVYGFGYDWRQSNLHSAGALLARIGAVLAENLHARKVILVTHSMGGLVARAAMMTGGKPLVLGIVHTVMPAAGAPQHHRRFHTGFRLALDGSGSSSVLDFIADLAFGRILGGPNGAAYSIMMGGLRGPMELLPTPKLSGPWLHWQDSAGTNWNDQSPGVWLYDEYRKHNDTPAGIVPSLMDSAQDWLGLPIDPTSFQIPFIPALPSPRDLINPFDISSLRDRIDDAEHFYNTVFASETPHENTYVIFVDKVMTDVRYDWRIAPTLLDGNAPRAIQHAAGDGTVPVGSGSFSTASVVEVAATTGLRHSDVFSDDGFRRKVDEFVRKILQRAATLSGYK